MGEEGWEGGEGRGQRGEGDDYCYPFDLASFCLLLNKPHSPKLKGPILLWLGPCAHCIGVLMKLRSLWL